MLPLLTALANLIAALAALLPLLHDWLPWLVCR